MLFDSSPFLLGGLGVSREGNRRLIAKQIMTALVTGGSEKSPRAKRSIEKAICALQKEQIMVAILGPPASPELQEAIRTKFPAKDTFFQNWIHTSRLVIDYSVPSRIAAARSRFWDALQSTETWASLILSNLVSRSLRHASVPRNENGNFCKRDA